MVLNQWKGVFASLKAADGRPRNQGAGDSRNAAVFWTGSFGFKKTSRVLCLHFPRTFRGLRTQDRNSRHDIPSTICCIRMNVQDRSATDGLPQKHKDAQEVSAVSRGFRCSFHSAHMIDFSRDRIGSAGAGPDDDEMQVMAASLVESCRVPRDVHAGKRVAFQRVAARNSFVWPELIHRRAQRCK